MVQIQVQKMESCWMFSKNVENFACIVFIYNMPQKYWMLVAEFENISYIYKSLLTSMPITQIMKNRLCSTFPDNSLVILEDLCSQPTPPRVSK